MEAFVLFDERLGVLAMVGGGVSIVGVALVVTQAARPDVRQSPPVISDKSPP
jgi:drug/metabolite transporter (DMT)-like permease